MIIDLLIQQVEYQVSIFMLTKAEIDNLNQNLKKVISDDVIENIFASKKERIAAANSVVKPIIVAIVKQRTAVTYTLEDLAKESKGLGLVIRYSKAS